MKKNTAEMTFEIKKYKESDNEMAFKKLLAHKIKKYFEQYEQKDNLSDDEAMAKICPSIYKYGYNEDYGYYVLCKNINLTKETPQYYLCTGFPVKTITDAFNLLLLPYLQYKAIIYNNSEIISQFQQRFPEKFQNHEVAYYENIYRKILKINKGKIPGNIEKLIFETINSHYNNIEWFYDYDSNQINYHEIKKLTKKTLDF